MMMTVVSCNGKQAKDKQWVDSVLRVCDSIPDDTLVYKIEDTGVSASVDEVFNDFLYTFTHNKEFQGSRVDFPLSVMNSDGETVRRIGNGSELASFFNPLSNDYCVMLFSDISQFEDATAGEWGSVQLEVVDLGNEVVRCVNCDRSKGRWMLTGAHETPLDMYPASEFIRFYKAFSNDNGFQLDHIMQPLPISIMDDEDPGERIEGTIDASQFSVFAPCLPKDRFLLLDYGQYLANPSKVVMVICGLGSGMIDIMTFEESRGNWKLISYEQ